MKKITRDEASESELKLRALKKEAKRKQTLIKVPIWFIKLFRLKWRIVSSYNEYTAVTNDKLMIETTLDALKRVIKAEKKQRYVLITPYELIINPYEKKGVTKITIQTLTR